MDAIRDGNFNSSEIVALTSMGMREMSKEELEARPKKGKGSATNFVADFTSLGKAALTFIEQCNTERRLGRSLTNESNAKPLSWGKLNEIRVHNILSTEYRLCSDLTLVHPTYPDWVGTPDFIRFMETIDKNKIVDSKCPMTLTSFTLFIDSWNEGFKHGGSKAAIDNVRRCHPDGEKYYWQLVSNGCLTGCDYAELIIYLPFKHELEEIKLMCEGIAKYYWIYYADDNELPYLVEGMEYNNLNVLGFDIPVEDKQFLRDRVALAAKKLNPRPVKKPEFALV